MDALLDGLRAFSRRLEQSEGPLFLPDSQVPSFRYGKN